MSAGESKKTLTLPVVIHPQEPQIVALAQGDALLLTVEDEGLQGPAPRRCMLRVRRYQNTLGAWSPVVTVAAAETDQAIDMRTSVAHNSKGAVAVAWSWRSDDSVSVAVSRPDAPEWKTSEQVLYARSLRALDVALDDRGTLTVVAGGRPGADNNKVRPAELRWARLAAGGSTWTKGTFVSPPPAVPHFDPVGAAVYSLQLEADDGSVTMAARYEDRYEPRPKSYTWSEWVVVYSGARGPESWGKPQVVFSPAEPTQTPVESWKVEPLFAPGDLRILWGRESLQGWRYTNKKRAPSPETYLEMPGCTGRMLRSRGGVWAAVWQCPDGIHVRSRASESAAWSAPLKLAAKSPLVPRPAHPEHAQIIDAAVDDDAMLWFVWGGNRAKGQPGTFVEARKLVH